MSSAGACTVCSCLEPRTVDRLLLLGRSPRRIAGPFGVTRRAVQRHAKLCLTGERRAKVAADLLVMAGEGEGGNKL